jgi:GT2 family glycosyltransferase
MQSDFHPLVSLLMPNYNNQHVLDLFFYKFLEHNTYDNYEFIVADDGSEDDGLEVLYKWQKSGQIRNLKILELPHNGIGKALNVMLAEAKGDFIIRLDGDATIETDGFIEQFLDFYSIAPEKIGAITCKVINDDGYLHAIGRHAICPEGLIDRGKEPNEPIGKRTQDADVRLSSNLFEIINEPSEVDTALGICTFYSKNLSVEMDGVDERFSPMWFEDDDQFLRMRLKNKKVFYIPNIEICHRYSLRGNRDPSAWSSNKGILKRLKNIIFKKEVFGEISKYKFLGITVLLVKDKKTWGVHGGGGGIRWLFLFGLIPIVRRKYLTWRQRHLNRQYKHWEQKWGFSMLNPDMETIKSRYADTEILWNYDRQMKSDGEAIVAEYKKRFGDKNYEKKDKRKLVILGSMAWFADSFVYFREQGFLVYVLLPIEVYKPSIFSKNFDVFKELGFNIINYTHVDSDTAFKRLKLDKNTLIISGGNFGGSLDSLDGFRYLSLYELDMLHKISKYNHDNSLGAKVIRFFNGDIGWGSRLMADVFNEKIKYVDILLFDNDLLKEYVCANISSAKEKKHILGWLETPLERFVRENKSVKVKKVFLALGRTLCSTVVNYPAKIVSYVNKHPNFIFRVREKFGLEQRQYSLACGGLDVADNACKITYRDRELFFDRHKSITFGLSHFFDTFKGSVENFGKYRNIMFSLNGQHLEYSDLDKFANAGVDKYCFPNGWQPYGIHQHWHAFFPFITNPSKDVSYLMNGIIPLISHTEHNLYKEFVNRKMAILIKDVTDFKRVLKMTKEDIFEYRKNIYKNRELFTFDHVADALMAEIDKNQKE